jgi:hypothetical protein
MAGEIDSIYLLHAIGGDSFWLERPEDLEIYVWEPGDKLASITYGICERPSSLQVSHDWV